LLDCQDFWHLFLVEPFLSTSQLLHWTPWEQGQDLGEKAGLGQSIACLILSIKWPQLGWT
jgi:hypothetical protein